MDEQVISAMAKWPNVPAVYGWLRLDARGQWHLIDRGAPGFKDALHGKGSPITSPPIKDFIERNYACNSQGQWYWQNGPQRAFVNCDVAPLIFRVMTAANNTTRRSLMAHTGELVSNISAVFSDGNGRVYLNTNLGPGAVHDMDLTQIEFKSSTASDTQLELEWQNQRFPVTALSDDDDIEQILGFKKKPEPAT